MTERASTQTTACSVCRSKKVKCDGALPRCSTCERMDQVCSVPEPPPSIVWLNVKMNINDTTDALNTQEVESYNRRRPLFTTRQRVWDTKILLSSISKNNVETLLDKVDTSGKSLKDGQLLSVGPFGVFKHQHDIQSEQSYIESPDLSPPTTDEAELDPAGLADFGVTLNASREDVPVGTDIDYTLACNQISDADLMLLNPTMDISTNSPNMGLLNVAYWPTTVGFSTDCASDLVDLDLSTSKLLLDHFQKTLISFFAPARIMSRSPWKALHLPCVLGTLGEIMMTGNGGNARVSLLFAVLATSAFNIDCLRSSNRESSSEWRAIGTTYRNKAKGRIKLALNDLSLPKKTGKYKEVLMALLSMVSICVFSGEMQEARCYMLDIDNFITLFGITKRHKSPKVQMLHSIYLYLRVLQDSTYTHSHTAQHEILGQKNVDQDTPLQSRAITQSATIWDNLLVPCSCDHACEKNTAGQNRAMSITPPSMFEQIYSVPESLFQLISQSTSMAYEGEKMRLQGRSKHSDQDTFAARVKDLEARICDWKNNYDPPSGPRRDTTAFQQEKLDDIEVIECEETRHAREREALLYHFIEALHAALIIYFYRCVRDLNAITLQYYVKQTIHHLLEYEKLKMRYNDTSSNICWPGFIAGCEALDQSSKEQISGWMERGIEQSGIGMFKVANKALKQVWNARKSSGNQNLSWNEILRQTEELHGLILS